MEKNFLESPKHSDYSEIIFDSLIGLRIWMNYRQKKLNDYNKEEHFCIFWLVKWKQHNMLCMCSSNLSSGPHFLFMDFIILSKHMTSSCSTPNITVITCLHSLWDWEDWELQYHWQVAVDQLHQTSMSGLSTQILVHTLL